MIFTDDPSLESFRLLRSKLINWSIPQSIKQRPPVWVPMKDEDQGPAIMISYEEASC